MSEPTDTPRIADATIRIDHLPPGGRAVDITPSEEERAELAAFLELMSLDSLEVKLTALPFRGGVRVEGTLRAALVQPSVVSLEPVRQEIAETVDRVFLPAGEKEFAGTADAEVFVDLEGEDVPDHFEGGEADLSDLVIETLALGIDPYPRLEGEELQAEADEVDEDESPFARLRELRRPDGETT